MWKKNPETKQGVKSKGKNEEKGRIEERKEGWKKGKCEHYRMFLCKFSNNFCFVDQLTEEKFVVVRSLLLGSRNLNTPESLSCSWDKTWMSVVLNSSQEKNFPLQLWKNHQVNVSPHHHLVVTHRVSLTGRGLTLNWNKWIRTT